MAVDRLHARPTVKFEKSINAVTVGTMRYVLDNPMGAFQYASNGDCRINSSLPNSGRVSGRWPIRLVEGASTHFSMSLSYGFSSFRYSEGEFCRSRLSWPHENFEHLRAHQIWIAIPISALLCRNQRKLNTANSSVNTVPLSKSMVC